MRTKFIIGVFACVLMAGCGGSGSDLVGVGPTLTLTQLPNVNQAPAQVTQNVTAPPSTPQVATATNPATGQQVQVTIPGGVSVKAGDTITYVPARLPIDATATSLFKGTGLRAPGNRSDIKINGTPTGLFLGSHGQIVDINGNVVTNITFGSGFVLGAKIRISIDFVSLGGTDRRLDINTMYVDIFLLAFKVGNFTGIYTTLPISITGFIPANGGTMAGADATAYFDPAGLSPTQGILTLKWPNVTKQQLHPNVANKVTFYDPNADRADQIPSVGIDSMEVDFSQ